MIKTHVFFDVTFRYLSGDQRTNHASHVRIQRRGSVGHRRSVEPGRGYVGGMYMLVVSLPLPYYAQAHVDC